MAVLYIVATPIGNLEDVSHRALRVLGEVEALACEDTRHTIKLLQRHELTPPQHFFSYHEHNEARSGKRILALLESGLSVAVCTDAGMPGISDPGYRIVSQCRETGIAVEVIPGPDAVSTALVASGLSTSSYIFKGFPPRKTGQRRRFLEADRDGPHTIVLFESPYRIGSLLQDALFVLGDRLAAVCVEMTKKFETIDRDYLSTLADRYTDEKVKGEITVVIAGNNPKFRRRERSS